MQSTYSMVNTHETLALNTIIAPTLWRGKLRLGEGGDLLRGKQLVYMAARELRQNTMQCLRLC